MFLKFSICANLLEPSGFIQSSCGSHYSEFIKFSEFSANGSSINCLPASKYDINLGQIGLTQQLVLAICLMNVCF